AVHVGTDVDEAYAERQAAGVRDHPPAHGGALGRAEVLRPRPGWKRDQRRQPQRRVGNAGPLGSADLLETRSDARRSAPRPLTLTTWRRNPPHPARHRDHVRRSWKLV